MRRFAPVLLTLVLLGGPALAGEKPEIPKDVDAKTLKRARERFKSEYDTKDIDFKIEAIKRFSKVQHKTVSLHLLKLLKDDDKHIRRAAAGGLAHQLSTVGKSGPKLMKLAGDDDEEPKVVAAAVDSLGKLDYQKAHKAIEPLIMKAEDPVVVAVFHAYGRWKSDRALSEMSKFWNKWPDEKGFVMVSVTVDTGTAGGGDQAAAAAKGKGMIAGHKSWRPRKQCTAALRWALKEITGKSFRRPDDLTAYMNAPKKYTDPEDVLKRLPEADQRAICEACHDAKTKARAHAEKEVPADEDGGYRAKVYYKEFWRIRAEIMEQYTLRLSEFDIVVEAGKKAGW